MSGSTVLRLTMSADGPRVGSSDVLLEAFLDGMKRVVFVDDRRDIERLGSGDLAVALGTTAGKTLTSIRRLASRLAKSGVVGLLVHERVLTDDIEPNVDLEGSFPVLVIDRDTEWADVLQPLVRIDFTNSGPELDSEARRARLVHDILVSGGNVQIEHPDDPARTGLDLDAPMRALYVAPVSEPEGLDRSRVEEAVGFELLDHDPFGTVVTLAGVVVAIEKESNLGSSERRVANSLLLRARRVLGMDDVMVGTGSFHSGAHGIFRSFREARWAARVGYRLHGPNHVMDFADLGPYAWLEPIDFQQGNGATLAIETILDHDRRHGTRFLDTLRAYLEARQLKDAAEALFVHRNTLRYRLEGITKLTGMDVQDPGSRLVLDIQMRLAIVRGLIDKRSSTTTSDHERASAG